MPDTPDADAPKNFARTPTSWDASDDILLMHLKDTQKLGWKEIASHFHNRTPNACQFRWRRLKSGNLKNPPKSAMAVANVGNGAQTELAAEPGARSTSGSSASTEGEKKGPRGAKRRPSELPGLNYSPLSNTTFTGYESVSSALAGLSALSSTNTLGAPHGPVNTTSHPQTFEDSPKSDVALDPQAHSAAAGSSGGYFTDISVDPTSNLPHNKPHPVASPGGMTPRNSASDQHFQLTHNNSIIQIVHERGSVSSPSRHSVSSLPSKSMDIPHHHRNSLAHLPVLFGGSSISGASGGPSSVSGPAGIPHLASTLSSIRNGSIVGPSQAYLRRSSMSLVHSERNEKGEKNERNEKTEKTEKLDKTELSRKRDRPDREKSHYPKNEHLEKTPRSASATATPTPQPVFKIPWSMEEDELLINRRRKELSFAELSILLPQRTEGEIWARIDALERMKNGHRQSVSRARHRQSSLGLDVDDFYDDVDSVIGGMDSDDDNDDVLVDVDDGFQARGKKRRASSAVNPLSVREGIRSRFQ